MAFSQYIADALLNWMRGTSFPSVPANLYVSLHTASPGATGANECADATYARVAVATTAGSWDAPSTGGGGRTTQNAGTITFPALTAGVTITHVGLWDAASGGNFLKGGALTASVPFSAAEIPVFPIGALDDTELTL
jgi:hypothetical protein